MTLDYLKAQIKANIETKTQRVQELEAELEHLRPELSQLQEMLTATETAEQSARSALEQAAQTIHLLTTVSPDQVEVFRQTFLELFTPPSAEETSGTGRVENGEGFTLFTQAHVEVHDAVGPI